MGVVYRAQNLLVPRMLRAVKIIRSDLSSDATFRARFLREAEYLDALQHPHILRIDNIGEESGQFFIVMELLEGHGLEQLIRRHPGGLPIDAAIGIMVQVLQGVEHAHTQGIIHRDLKPSNLFVTRAGQAKVLDFGVARHNADPALTLTTQLAPGSPAYYAPELLHGERASVASDLYALGITFFELLAGYPPFRAAEGSEGQVRIAMMIQHQSQPLPDLRRVRPDVPDALEAAVRRATAKNPRERYSSALEFAQALEAFGATTSLRSLVSGVPAQATPQQVAETRSSSGTDRDAGAASMCAPAQTVAQDGLLGATAAAGTAAAPPVPKVGLETRAAPTGMLPESAPSQGVRRRGLQVGLVLLFLLCGAIAGMNAIFKTPDEPRSVARKPEALAIEAESNPKPSFEEKLREAKSKVFFDEATAAVKLSKWQDAISSAGKSIELMPEWLEPYLLRAEAYSERAAQLEGEDPWLSLENSVWDGTEGWADTGDSAITWTLKANSRASCWSPVENICCQGLRWSLKDGSFTMHAVGAYEGEGCTYRGTLNRDVLEGTSKAGARFKLTRKDRDDINKMLEVHAEEWRKAMQAAVKDMTRVYHMSVDPALRQKCLDRIAILENKIDAGVGVPSAPALSNAGDR